MTWLVILAMYYKIFQDMLFQNHRFLHVEFDLYVPDATATANAENHGHPKSNVRGTHAVWTSLEKLEFDCCTKGEPPSQLESVLQFVLLKQKHVHQS